MAGIRHVFRTSFPEPSDPYPSSGDVVIQGEVDPPPMYEHGRLLPKDQMDVEQWTIYPRNLVFTTKKQEATMTRSFRTTTGKKRREGNVPRIFANWYNRAYGDGDEEDIRCLGISYEGIANGSDARLHPLEAGRCAVLMSGAASIVVDKRFLDNPTFGDYLEWIPVESGARPESGSEKYSLPIVRNISPAAFRVVVGGVLGRGAQVQRRQPYRRGGGGGGANGDELHDLATTLVAYNALLHTAEDNLSNGNGGDVDVRSQSLRIAYKAWHFKKPGMIVGQAAVANAFDNDESATRLWRAAGLQNNLANARASLQAIMRLFFINAEATTIQEAGFSVNQRFTPLIRLPMANSSGSTVQDTILNGSPHAPGILAHMANVLAQEGNQRAFPIDMDEPLVLRYYGVNAGNQDSDVNHEAAAVAALAALAAGGPGNIVNLFDNDANVANFAAVAAVAPRTVQMGIRGNDNTYRYVTEYEIPNSAGIIAANKIAFCNASVVAMNGTRWSIGAPAARVNHVLEPFCSLCEGRGGQNVLMTPDEAGRELFGADWDALTAAQRQYFTQNDGMLQKFRGFPPAIVMEAIHAELNERLFWFDHPALVRSFGIGNTTANTHMDLTVTVGGGDSHYLVPYNVYFGVHLNTTTAGQYVASMAPSVDGALQAITSGKFDDPSALHESMQKANDTLPDLGAVATGVPMRAERGDPARKNVLENANDIAVVKGELANVQIDPRRIFGIFMEQSVAEPNEVRVLLRPFMPRP